MATSASIAAPTSEPSVGPGPGWGQLAPILAVQFIGTLGFSIALPFLVFLITDFGGAAWTFGLVGATYSASQLVGAPLLGRWSDRSGRRPVLILSQAGTLVAWLVFLLALSLPLDSLGTIAGATITIPLLLVFGARVLDGLTGGNISVANAYVADITRGQKEGRRIAFGRMGMAASLGFTLGPALAGVLGGVFEGYTAPVAAAAAISAVATVLCMTLREPEDRCPDGPPPQSTVTKVMGQQQRRCDRETPKAPRSTLRRPIIVALLVATFGQFLAFNLFYAGFPIYAAEEIGWSASQMGLFFALMSAVMFVAQGPVLERLSARLSSTTVFRLGLVGLIVSFAVFATPYPAAMYAGAFLFALGNGLSWPTFQARIADAATDEEQGAVQGATTSAGSFASIAGLLVGGVAYPWLGSGLFLAGASVFVLVAIASSRLFRDPKD